MDIVKINNEKSKMIEIIDNVKIDTNKKITSISKLKSDFIKLDLRLLLVMYKKGTELQDLFKKETKSKKKKSHKKKRGGSNNKSYKNKLREKNEDFYKWQRNHSNQSNRLSMTEKTILLVISIVCIINFITGVQSIYGDLTN